MKRHTIWLVTLTVLIGLSAALYLLLPPLNKASEKNAGIQPRVVADYLHAVIEANRTIYATQVVEKMQEKGIVEAAEHWKQLNALPLPAQFLIETGRFVVETGVGIKYRLMSLWPIYVWNAPSTEFERKGLEAVSQDPDSPYYGFVQIGSERYFQAIYADRAVAHSCVECHNTHMNSPKRGFKLGDVMGGIVVTIPVGG
ncbi:MAG: Tll0287-like domain-containing protein [Nitrospirales bacterium]